MAWNYFASAHGKNLRSVNEDFLTSTLAALMDGIPELRRAFLQRIVRGGNLPDEIVDRDWSIDVQKSFKTERFGDAYLDMVFEASDRELWFEHKVQSSEGVRQARDGSGESISQLGKYQAARLIHESESTSPKSVLLFFITADVQKMNRNEIGGCYDGTKGGGYVWCEPYGHFLWSEFHPILRDVLVGLKNDAPDELTTRLLGTYLDWWNTAPSPAIRSAPSSPTLYPRSPAELSGLWPLAKKWLESTTGRKLTTYGGAGLGSYGEQPGVKVDYIGIWPERVEKVAGWNPSEHGTNVLKVSLQVADDVADPKVPKDWRMLDGRWPCLVHADRRNSKKPNSLTWWYYVGLTDWDDRLDDAGRQRAILGAVQAAIHDFEGCTGIKLVQD